MSLFRLRKSKNGHNFYDKKSEEGKSSLGSHRIEISTKQQQVLMSPFIEVNEYWKIPSHKGNKIGLNLGKGLR